MLVKAENFKGEIPKIKPRLLPPGFAEVARNVRLADGSILPLRAPVAEETLDTPAMSITFHANSWRSWASVVNAVPGPVATDRLYVTGDDQPRIIRPSGTVRNLALPAPATAPTVAVTGGTPDPNIQSDIVFCFTFVTDDDEESRPSPVSEVVQWHPPLGVHLTNLASPPSGRGVNRRRFYRSETSALGITDLYFIAEQPISANSFLFEPNTHPIQEVLPSNDYDMPPSDMEGIISMPNGMMAAFSGKELLFSEPFIPHAWPRKYRLKTDYPIVGLAAFGSTLAILTTGQPYLAQGTAPENMVMERLEVNYPCASPRSIVDLGYSAVYASPEGLVMIGNGRAEVISRRLWTREQWAALTPSSFIASQYDGAYVVSYRDTPMTRKIMVIDLTGEQPFLTHADIQAAAMHYDIQTGSLFFLEGVMTGTQIRKWDSGAPMQYLWRSGTIHSGGAVSFGAGMTQTDEDEGQSITTRVIANGATIRETQDTDVPFRLPAGLYERWQVECSGNAPVTGYLMAGDITSLSGG